MSNDKCANCPFLSVTAEYCHNCDSVDDTMASSNEVYCSVCGTKDLLCVCDAPPRCVQPDKQCTDCGVMHSGARPSCASCESEYNRGTLL